jgi:hypothetical protein
LDEGVVMYEDEELTILAEDGNYIYASVITNEAVSFTIDESVNGVPGEITSISVAQLL